jgi:hypothetical protein
MENVQHTVQTKPRAYRRPPAQREGWALNRKRNPSRIAEKSELEVLSMLVGARAADVLLAEYGSIKALGDYGAAKGFGAVSMMPYCGWGVVGRLEAWLELSGRLRTG